MLILNFASGQSLYTYGFDGTTSTMINDGWVRTNQSAPVGPSLWVIPISYLFPFATGGQDGGLFSLTVVNYNSTAFSPNPGIFSNWLISPPITVDNGDIVSYYTRKGTNMPPVFPDNMQFRMSSDANTVIPSGGPSDVGSFTTLCQEINPTLNTTSYPFKWTPYFYTISGLSGPTACQFAFRYYATDAGISGANGDVIGVDSFKVERPLSTDSFFQNNLLIYPNPASNLLNVNSNSVMINSIQISDSSGRLVKKLETINDNFSQIAISDISAGIYFIRVTTDQGIGTSKLIKQ